MGRCDRAGIVLLILLLVGGCRDEPPPDSAVPQPGPEVLERLTRPGDGGRVHLVQMLQRGDQYAFDPAQLRIAPGDVVRFVMVGTQPESVAFDTAAATPEAGRYLRDRGLHLGVLLTDAGQTLDVAFPDAPPGRYPFLSVPHAVHGMRGEVLIGTPE